MIDKILGWYCDAWMAVLPNWLLSRLSAQVLQRLLYWGLIVGAFVGLVVIGLTLPVALFILIPGIFVYSIFSDIFASGKFNVAVDNEINPSELLEAELLDQLEPGDEFLKLDPFDSVTGQLDTSLDITKN